MIDLFDAVSTSMFAQVGLVARETRLRGLRDLDAAALRLRDAGAVFLDEATPDADIRASVFALVRHDHLAQAVERVGQLAAPVDDGFFAELRRRPGKLRYVPVLLRGLELDAAPAGRALLEAVDYLGAVQAGGRRVEPAPTAFASKAWGSQLKNADGRLDLAGYRLAVLDGLRHAIRRRDVFPVRSLRYADPRGGLLDGAAWEAARSAICRTIGVSASADEEIGQLSTRLDLAWRETAARVPGNAAVAMVQTTTGPDLSVEPLDRLEEPLSLIALRTAVDARLPRLDLPELVLEVHARTGFADRFTHASEGSARAVDMATSLCAVLVVEATNTGFEQLLRRDVPALRRSRLSWVKQHLPHAPTRLPLPTPRSCRRRMRSPWPGIGAAARWPRPTACGSWCRSGPSTPAPTRATSARAWRHWYTLASDQYTGLNAVTVPGTLRDSLNLLAVVQEQETELSPAEIMTDTAGYTDTIFGVFHLLGFQFSPRIAHMGGARFRRADARAHYGVLDALATHKLNLHLFAEHWDDRLRLAGSLNLGVVRAAGLTRTLQTNDRPTKLARALHELGRLVETL